MWLYIFRKEIRQEIQDLKKQYQTDKKIKDELLEKKEDSRAIKETVNADNNELIANFLEEKQKYSGLKQKIPKKGASRLALWIMPICLKQILCFFISGWGMKKQRYILTYIYKQQNAASICPSAKPIYNNSHNFYFWSEIQIT